MKINIVLIFILFFVACTDTTFYWNEVRGVTRIKAIVNDSLALFSSSRGWNKSVNKLLYEEDTKGGENEGLHLMNFRNKSPLIWSDTLDYNVNIEGQLTDSVVFGGDLNTEVSFWKIGQKPVTKKVRSWVGSCSPRMPKNILYTDYQIRPWRDGKFLILGSSTSVSGDTCQYAVLDTSTGVIEQSRFSDNDSWMSGCDDISYQYNAVICLKRVSEPLFGIDLLVEGLVVDSIRFDSYKFVEVPALSFYGQYAAVILSVLKGLSPVNGWQRIYKLEQDMQKFNDTYPEIWLTPGPYGLVDSTGEKVTYDDEDIKMSLEKIP